MSRSARLLAMLAAAAMLGWSSGAAAQSVRITKLTDVSVAVTNPLADTVAAQNVCAFSNANGRRYSVRANGSGTGGAFTLALGARTLAYEVQWNGLSGQTTGTTLTANVRSGVFTSAATQGACNTGPATSASLIVNIRTAAASAATAGTYTGTLTLLVAPE